MTSSSTLPAHHDTPSSSGLVPAAVVTRMASLDIFRGFTMAVMIFVNDLSGVEGLSRWTYHIPARVDAMSYVDMVFPFFLFAVGLSLPISVKQRLRRDPSLLHLWGHILARCFALEVLGLILANAEKTSRALTHMRGSVWASLALLGGILFWAVYPKQVSPRTAYLLKGLGAVLLLTMLALYRRVSHGQVAWLDFGYPEILGLIGCTYFAVCLLYLPTRRFAWAPAAWLAVLLGFNALCAAHRLTPPHVDIYFFPFDNGAMAAITMAGVLVSAWFLGTEAMRLTPTRKLLRAAAFTLACLVLGFVLRPLGISKIRATPTWALWSVAGATAVFALFYWICDLRKRTIWATPFRAPGANTLLTYLLPDLAYFALAITGLSRPLADSQWSYGLPGVLRALVFTGAMLVLSWGVTRAKLRMQL